MFLENLLLNFIKLILPCTNILSQNVCNSFQNSAVQFQDTLDVSGLRFTSMYCCGKPNHHDIQIFWQGTGFWNLFLQVLKSSKKQSPDYMFHLRALKDNITQWKLEFKNFKGDMQLGLDFVIDSPSVRTTSQLNFFPRICH